MKKINLILLVSVLGLLIFSSCGKEDLQVEEGNKSLMEEGKTIADYPSEITIDNWEEFIYAPQAVIDYHSEKEITREAVEPNATEREFVFGNVRAVSGNNFTGIQGVRMSISGKGCGSFSNTNLWGNYFLINNNCSVQLCAEYNSPNNTPLNGVSTLDLVLISRHILNIVPFTAAWQEIAADVNRSGTITGFDLVQIRKLILFIDTEWPNSENLIHLPLVEYNDAESLMPGIPPSLLQIYGTFGPCNNLNIDTDRRIIKTGDVNGSFNF